MGIDFATVDWKKKLVALGIDSQCLTGKAGPCPFCYGTSNENTGNGEKKSGTQGSRRFRFDNKGGLGTWYCQKCGAGNGFTLIEGLTGMSKVEILKFLDDGTSGLNPETPIKRFTFEDADFNVEQVRKNRKKLGEVSAGCLPLTGQDPVSQYLHNRVPGCDLSKISDQIKYHSGLKFYVEVEPGKYVLRGNFPTMIGRAVDSNEQPITLHRTYLTPQGTKAPVEEVKKQMKGIRKLDGAAIRVVEVPESRTLGLTEGIETGLAVATGYRYRINVWSMLNCVNLSLADIPKGRFDKIIIFADHDKIDKKHGYRPGEHYAMKLKERLEKLGYEVVIKIPPVEETDFADVWAAIYAEEQKRLEPVMLKDESLISGIKLVPIVRPQQNAYA